MYRAVACRVAHLGIDPRANPLDAIEVARTCRLDIDTSANRDLVVIDGDDVTEEIRHPDTSAKVSAVATIPDAQVRVLLVADPAVRIARRQAELGEKVDMEQVIDSIVRRDRDDSTVSTFEQPAEGVTLIDSTRLNLEQVIDAVIGLVPQSLR